MCRIESPREKQMEVGQMIHPATSKAEKNGSSFSAIRLTSLQYVQRNLSHSRRDDPTSRSSIAI